MSDPGLSIVAIDPGGTTGVAIWDAWSGKLYIDQIDAGRGRKARERVWPGVVESWRRRRGFVVLGKKPSEMSLLDYIEGGVAFEIEDLIAAAGPKCVVICEDFILTLGGGMGVRSSGREGLSAVRIRQRLRVSVERGGFLNGDLWRAWDGFGATGADSRGVKLGRNGKMMSFEERLWDVKKWNESGWPDCDGSIWAGGGVKWLDRLPGTRHWLSGGEVATVAWLKERGLWMTSAPHGMDALMHLIAFGRRIGLGDLPRGERLFGGAK